jgi:DNA-binding response OmpR family regulator
MAEEHQMHPPDVVAVINTSPDTVEMLRTTLERAGFVVITGFTFEIRDGRLDVDALVTKHQPVVVIYDVAPPYDQNWRLFQHVRGLESMKSRKFVITSTNPRHLEQLAGRDDRIYEIVGRPLDLDAVVTAVKEALRSRPTR